MAVLLGLTFFFIVSIFSLFNSDNERIYLFAYTPPDLTTRLAVLVCTPNKLANLS